mmetsp:Transcript_39016/g.78010  ORF Transcript_39016/g.78010 Transcript_39016/m.78010 type:complete len:232 (+) Transcript_39016:201-896(+)
MVRRMASQVPVALHAASRKRRPYEASVTFPMASKEVMTPSTTGKWPLVRTGECRPSPLTAPFSAIVVAAANAPVLSTSQIGSPISTSLACLRTEQHVAPTGRWWAPVRTIVLPVVVVNDTNTSSLASCLAIEIGEMVSVVMTPSFVAATMVSPAASASTRDDVPSDLVTVAEEAKQGSSESLPPLEVEDEDEPESVHRIRESLPADSVRDGFIRLLCEKHVSRLLVSGKHT